MVAKIPALTQRILDLLTRMDRPMVARALVALSGSGMPHLVATTLIAERQRYRGASPTGS